MPRYALKIEYDGGPFRGWQRQANLPTVQGAVEDALRKLEPHHPGIGAAGRTDTGVHATGQVAHCDMARDWDPFRLGEALNHHLKPLPVAILTGGSPARPDRRRGSPAPAGRSAGKGSAARPRKTLHASPPRQRPRLEADRMNKAAQHLVGEHDFTTFRASECQAASPVKTLDEARVDAQPIPHGQEIRFTFRARSFLHNQVRSMVGTLERVGAGAWDPADVARVLAAKDRAQCGPVCPPQGLYLTGVRYPQDPFETA